MASHGPAKRQLLLRIGLAFFIELLHIPVGADEAPSTGFGSLQRPEATSASQVSWFAARWGSLAFLASAG